MTKKVKIYLGIPSMGDRWDYQVYCLRDIEKRYADEVELVFPQDCVHRFQHDFARNEIVEEFLNSDCDVLWFLDADVAPAAHVLDLVTIHANKNWLAAGAPYPLWLNNNTSGNLAVAYTVYKGTAPDANGNTGLKYASVLTSGGSEFVDGLATGCLFLKRELFEKLEKPYFQFKRKPESQECIEGEDLGFALKLKNLGIKYFVDHGMVCGHYKKVNLLDVQNYATEMSNAKVIAMHEQIKGEIDLAIKMAFQKGVSEGHKQATAGALKSAMPNRTQSGLILPSSL
jgi:hypothetical protein